MVYQISDDAFVGFVIIAAAWLPLAESVNTGQHYTMAQLFSHDWPVHSKQTLLWLWGNSDPKGFVWYKIIIVS